jgi:transcriptional regulator with XRE-family HTH domain
MSNKEIFSYNLKYYMDMEGKSRKEVADAIDVSYFTFTDWVKGKTYPRMNMVEKLAKYFGIRISDLVEKRGIETRPVETALKHVDMLKDDFMIEIYERTKDMDGETKKRVLSYAKFLADERD